MEKMQTLTNLCCELQQCTLQGESRVFRIVSDPATVSVDVFGHLRGKMRSEGEGCGTLGM